MTVCLQTKEHQVLPASTRGWGRGLDQILPSQSSERTNPALTLILDFWPLELGDNTFLCLKTTWFVVLCYSSSRNLTHLPKGPHQAVYATRVIWGGAPGHMYQLDLRGAETQ